MFSRTRTREVFVIALISIGIGAVVLRTLSNNPLPAGAFSLSEYYSLTPLKEVITSDIVKTTSHWNRIEINHTGLKPTTINKDYSQSDVVNYGLLNCHFIVWNGLIGGDGQIQSTEKWRKQLSITSAQNRYRDRRTIRISVIVDEKNASPTEFQIKRTEALVDALGRMFFIKSESICYPENWK